MPAIVLDNPFDEVETKALKGGKGFDREELPQIKGEDVDKFLAFLRRKDVEVESRETRVADLKPTQSELNTEKVEKLAKDGMTDALRSAIIISSDDYILDGHHRWAAVKKLDKDGTIKTKRASVPIKRLIQLGHEFPKSFTKEIDEAQLDEEIQQLRKYLLGTHQVVDHGTVGLFRVYSVTTYPDDTSIIPVRNLRAVHGARWSYEVGKVRTVAYYRRNRINDPEDVTMVSDPVAEGWPKIRANIQEASNAILTLGVPRQRDTLILLDLSGHRNPITGGGVGGYAYRKTHAIELDTASMLQPGGSELLVHEWGHKQFFNLPQHVTDYVREWFKVNLVQRDDLHTVPELSDKRKATLVEWAWERFNDSWRDQRGLDLPDFIAAYKRAQREGVSDSQTDRLLDYVSRGKPTAHGIMLKGVRNPEGGRGLRKGDRARVISARATGPDQFALLGAPGMHIILSRRELLDVFELDFGRTKKENPDVDIEQFAYSANAIASADPIRLLTLEHTMWNALDAAGRWLAERFKAAGHGNPSLIDVMSIDGNKRFQEQWTERVQREKLDFDPKKAFLDIYAANVTWPETRRADDPLMRAATLTGPDGERVRELARELKITPSSYAAANVDELWAELIAHTAMRPARVPKPLKELFRDAMQGKTPGGQRVKVDRTPAQYRESIDMVESAAVTKPQLDALERQLDALFKAAGIDIEFTRHFLDRVNDERNVRQITIEELRRIYQAVWDQHRKTLDTADVDWRVVIRDLPTQINIPVVLDYDTRTGRVELVAKTIMRTPRFMAREPQLVVRSETMEESWLATTQLPMKGEVIRFLADRGFGATEDEMWAQLSNERFFRGDRASLRKLLKALTASHRLRFDGEVYSFVEGLEEGVDDPHVLKAVFLAGGGGSGKSFIGKKTFGDTGLRVVNTDPHFERLMQKAGLDTKKDVGSAEAQKLRPRAKELAAKQEKLLTDGRVGIIIDGTGDNPEKIKKKKAELEALGYDTSMVFVDVPLDVALARNKKRARVVPEEVLKDAHKLSQEAKETYKQMFGGKFANVVNDKEMTPEEITRDLVPKLARVAKRLVDGPVENPVGRKWVKSQLGAGETRHRALGKGDTVSTPEKKPDVDEPESLIRWRTTRRGQKLGFDRKGRVVAGNPHLLKLMRSKKESLEERVVSLTSMHDLRDIHGSVVPPGTYTLHPMHDNEKVARLRSAGGKGYLIRKDELDTELVATKVKRPMRRALAGVRESVVLDLPSFG